MNFITYPDVDALMMSVANVIADDINDALHSSERATLSVPGGSTPGPVFDALSATHLPWDRVSVVLNDERWVPEDNPRSNTALLRKRLFTGQASKATLVPLYADTPTPEEGLEGVQQQVSEHLPISVLLLGMGADMHTASLFPGADNLAAALATDAPPLMAMRADGAGEPRITLTAPVLQAAPRIHILIKGEDKRAALEVAKAASQDLAPIACVLSQANVHWCP